MANHFRRLSVIEGVYVDYINVFVTPRGCTGLSSHIDTFRFVLFLEEMVVCYILKREFSNLWIFLFYWEVFLIPNVCRVGIMGYDIVYRIPHPIPWGIYPPSPDHRPCSPRKLNVRKLSEECAHSCTPWGLSSVSTRRGWILNRCQWKRATCLDGQVRYRNLPRVVDSSLDYLFTMATTENLCLIVMHVYRKKTYFLPETNILPK